MEVVAECLPTKLKAKHRVLLETLAVKKKFDDVKTASLCNKRILINPNNQKFKKAQSELNNTYLKEQTEYIQDEINKSRDSVEDRQSMIAWWMVNKVNRRKSTARAKLKAASQVKRYICRNNISRIYSENLRKLQKNQSQKLLVIN